MTRDTTLDRLATDDRSASEVVAMALLLGIVMLGISAILLISVGELRDDQESVEVDQAEQALVQFDDDASRVATGGTTSQQVDLGLRINRGTLDIQPDRGHITIEYFDPFDPLNGTEVMNTSMGTVLYESGDTTVGYQGGGVWRSDENGSVMVSPPEFSNNGKTVTLPVVKTTRGGSVHSDVQISHGGSTEQFPNETRDANLTNKVDDGIVQITIESQYYRAWGQYFEDETNAEVVYPPNRDAVILIFLGSKFNLGREAGIIATSGPGEIRVEGTGSYIDSYNSTDGPYSETATQSGVVKSAGDIDMFGGSEIRGDAHSNKEILLDGGSEITGDACANEGVTTDGTSTVHGDTNCTASVPILPPLDSVVDQKTDELAGSNDNNETNAIQNRHLNFGSDDEIVLEPGEYYLEEIEMENNETLILNASRGHFSIAVENYVVLDEGQIEVTGNDSDGDVKMYIASRESSGITIPGSGSEPADHFYVDGDSRVHIQNDSSPRFQVLAPHDFTGAIRASGSDEPQMIGIVLAPTPAEGPSQFVVRDAELFGAVVTGNLSAENNAQVHFDRAIIGEDIPFGAGSLIDYLYVSENRIEVEST